MDSPYFSKLFEKSKAFWLAISNLGVETDAIGREVIKVRLLNQLIFLAMCTSLMALTTYLIFFRGIEIVYTTIANLTMESMGLYAAFRRKHDLSRFLAAFAFPTLIAVNVVILGGNFGEANIFMALTFSAFIFYEGKRLYQGIAILYNSFLFAMSKLYVIHFASVVSLSPEPNPYDEIVTFPMLMIILGLIVILYQREIMRFEEQRTELIHDLEDKHAELERFTYIASHDLKSPVRSVSNFLDLMLLHLRRNEPVKLERDIKMAKEGTTRMYALLVDILEVNHLNNRSANPEKVDLTQLFQANVLKMKEKFPGVNFRLAASNLPHLEGNKEDFALLFRHLIDNGLTYNISPQPMVEVNHVLTEDSLFLQFQDNGIGIDQEYHEKVFSFFYRLHGAEEYPGTGMGLGVCQKIVRKYRGDIRIHSSSENGTIFEVRFPRRMLDAARQLIR
ncbi:MAG: ATP-binding protein [Bacteroidia bacterium]|nr:ATP-binding protein [Bacteroidia bacterium]